KNKRDLAEQLRHGSRDCKQRSGADRLVMIWAASPEVFLTPGPAHQSLAAFEKAMEQNDPAIAPSMLYAYAALMENVPFANGAPNLTVDVPALERLAEERTLPIGGKDFKTGQTMMKTVLAPAFKARMLGRDSILAAPIVLDLALFFDLAQRARLSGIQEWLSFYFKSPQTAPGLYPEHDLFIQHTKLKNTLRWLMGEEQITHLGIEYYEKA